MHGFAAFKTLGIVALALAFAAVVVSHGAAQSSATPSWRGVAPGVEHAHVVRDGPWNINLLRVDLSQARLDVVRAMDEAVGLETVSSMAGRHDAIAAINGGYFRTTGTFRGDSAGTVVVDGALLSEPDRGRAAVGIIRTSEGSRLVFGHVVWQATIEAADRKRAIDGINRPRGANDLVVFTPQFHRTTLTEAGGLEVVVRGNRVVEVREGGSTVIPADGLVISALGAARQWAAAALRRGSTVRVSWRLAPADPSPANVWASAEDVLAAGPTLVTDGRVDVTDQREKMVPTFATDLHPRTAIASLADGRALLAVVDGRQPAISIGMSLEALARLLIEFGAREAINLDGGGSTAMVVQGKVVNHPSDATGERPVSDAIVIRARNPAP